MKHVSVFCEKGIKADKRSISRMIEELSDQVGMKLMNIDLNLVNSETILDVNRRFLGHDYKTDIITFDYSDEKNTLDGEIFISLPEALENSKKYRISVDNEVSRLVIHGILHLSGFDDKTPQKRKVMKRREDELLRKFKKMNKGLIIKNDD